MSQINLSILMNVAIKLMEQPLSVKKYTWAIHSVDISYSVTFKRDKSGNWTIPLKSNKIKGNDTELSKKSFNAVWINEMVHLTKDELSRLSKRTKN